MGEDAGVGAVMTREEIDAFLGRGGTGVLSLARDDEPYATPISYGYDPNSGAFYIRLGFTEGSEKRAFVAPEARARLVSYGRVDGVWTSVIAVGVLEPVEAEDLDVETAKVLREGDFPLYDAWGDAIDRVEFRIYRLDVEDVTGRTTADD